MTRGFDMIPGVPASGHLSPGGFWHNGRAADCDRCNPPADRKPTGHERLRQADRDNPSWPPTD